jgi:hypothetical protein
MNWVLKTAALTGLVLTTYGPISAQRIHLTGGPENDIVSDLAVVRQILYAASAGPSNSGLFVSTDQRDFHDSRRR